MLRTWRKKDTAQANGLKKQPDRKTASATQAVMCSIRKLHIPIKKKPVKKASTKHSHIPKN
jgi:hypothetical protein